MSPIVSLVGTQSDRVAYGQRRRSIVGYRGDG